MKRARWTVLGLALVGLAMLVLWYAGTTGAPAPGPTPRIGRPATAAAGEPVILAPAGPEDGGASGEVSAREAAAPTPDRPPQFHAGLLEGRVFDAGGRPVGGAQVHLERREEDGDFHMVGLGRSDDEGTYHVFSETAGPHRVVARHAELGSGSVAFELSPEDRTLPDVVLHPVSVLDGTLRFPDGSPVARMSILVTREGFAPGGPEAGLNVAMATTGDDGSFRFAGLVPGTYDLAWEPGVRRGEKRPPLPTGPLRHDVVCDASRIVLDVASDEVVEAAFYEYCQALGPRDPRTGGVDPVRRGFVRGAKSFLVEPGARYAVGLLAQGRIYAEEIVEVPDRPGDTVVVLEPWSADKLGEIELAIRGADGLPTGDYSLVVRSSLSGRQVLAANGERIVGLEAEAGLRLFPGSYRVQIWPSAGGVGPPAVTRDVTVRAGGRTPLDVRLARADLELVLEVPEEERAELRGATPPDTLPHAGLRIKLGGVSLSPEPVDGDPLRLRVTGLAAGVHELSVSGRRIEAFERTVTLSGDATTRIVLPLLETPR